MLKKFNILLITSSLRIGGEERSTLSIAKGMKENGHNVWVMTTDGPLFSVYEESGINVVFANVDKRTILGVIKGVRDIRRFVIQNNIQIIHSQSVVPAIMAYFASRRMRGNRPKVIWHCRGIKNISYWLVGKFFNYMTDLVIVNSRFEMNRLVKNGLSRDHVNVIYNCINVDFPHELKKNRNNHPVVASVSRLASQKGIEYFLEAAKTVLQKMPDVHFLIVGDGPLKNRLQQKAVGLGIDDAVEFAGFKKDMREVYPAIDILVFPSLWEPFGNVAVEAAAYSVPVIASNVGGIPEAVADGKTGILVPPGKTDKLAEAILYLLRNPDFSHRMGQAGRERVMRNFTSDHLIKELEKTYGRACAIPTGH